MGREEPDWSIFSGWFNGLIVVVDKELRWNNCASNFGSWASGSRSLIHGLWFCQTGTAAIRTIYVLVHFRLSALQITFQKSVIVLKPQSVTDNNIPITSTLAKHPKHCFEFLSISQVKILTCVGLQDIFCYMFFVLI